MDDEAPVIRATKGGLLQQQPTRRNAITVKMADVFLAELAQSANIRRAARLIDVSLGTIYNRRRKNPAFAAAWDRALSDAHDKLTAEMLSRAIAPMADPDPDAAEAAAAHALPPMSDETRLRLLGLHARRVERHRAGAGIDGRIEAERLREMIAERMRRLDRRYNGTADGDD